MSVVCRLSGASEFRVFVKGAPERITDLCLDESLPPNYEKVLASYTIEGYRVIALAYKDVDSDCMVRDETESNLTFLGLLVMENKLKPESSEVIEKLHLCDVDTIMATGDNILTAVSVAR